MKRMFVHLYIQFNFIDVLTFGLDDQNNMPKFKKTKDEI